MKEGALTDAFYSNPGVNMRFEIVCLPSSSSHPYLGFVSPSNFIEKKHFQLFCSFLAISHSG